MLAKKQLNSLVNELPNQVEFQEDNESVRLFPSESGSFPPLLFRHYELLEVYPAYLAGH